MSIKGSWGKLSYIQKKYIYIIIESDELVGVPPDELGSSLFRRSHAMWRFAIGPRIFFKSNEKLINN